MADLRLQIEPIPAWRWEKAVRGKSSSFGSTEHESELGTPLGWRKPAIVFVNSMSDLFHERISDDFIAKVFAVMAATPRHTYQVLTKRHARMRSLLSRDEFRVAVKDAHSVMRLSGLIKGLPIVINIWPLPNVWLGVSVEDQYWADRRVPALLKTPASVRFLSCEPLLGPIDLDNWFDEHGPWNYTEFGVECSCRAAMIDEVRCNGDRIDWVIAGGESGPGARPMHPDWARSLRDQCTAAGVPFHFKQRGQWTWTHNPGDPWNVHEPDAWVHADTGQVMTEAEAMADGGAFQGVWRVGKKAAGRDLSGRTWDEFPEAVSR